MPCAQQQSGIHLAGVDVKAVLQAEQRAQAAAEIFGAPHALLADGHLP